MTDTMLITSEETISRLEEAGEYVQRKCRECGQTGSISLVKDGFKVEVRGSTGGFTAQSDAIVGFKEFESSRRNELVEMVHELIDRVRRQLAKAVETGKAEAYSWLKEAADLAHAKSLEHNFRIRLYLKPEGFVVEGHILLKNGSMVSAIKNIRVMYFELEQVRFNLLEEKVREMVAALLNLRETNKIVNKKG